MVDGEIAKSTKGKGMVDGEIDKSTGKGVVDAVIDKGKGAVDGEIGKSSKGKGMVDADSKGKRKSCDNAGKSLRGKVAKVTWNDAPGCVPQDQAPKMHVDQARDSPDIGCHVLQFPLAQPNSSRAPKQDIDDPSSGSHLPKPTHPHPQTVGTRSKPGCIKNGACRIWFKCLTASWTA